MNPLKLLSNAFPTPHAAFIVPSVFFLLAVLFNIMAIASVSTVGGEIHALDLKRSSLKKQNDMYELEIAKSQSLQSIKEEAIVSGFVPIQGIVAIDPNESTESLQAKR